MRFKFYGHIQRNLMLIITLLTITSCKLLESSLINSCSSSIIINIQYDNALLPLYSGGMDGFYKLIDKSIEGNKTQMISFDSVNFIASYLLNQTDTFFIKPAVKYRKDTIYIIKEMLVVNNQDTIKLDDYYSFNFMFFNDSLKYKPFKIEGFYFEQINE